MFEPILNISSDCPSCSCWRVCPLPKLDGRPPIIVPSDAKLPGLELAYDEPMPARVPVFAVADGVITHAGPEHHGRGIVIDHGNGWSTYYGNLEHMFARPTRGGARARAEQVKAGDVLGYVGAPAKGAPRGLHFQLWKHDEEGLFEPVDTTELLRSWLVLPWFADETQRLAA